MIFVSVYDEAASVGTVKMSGDKLKTVFLAIAFFFVCGVLMIFLGDEPSDMFLAWFAVFTAVFSFAYIMLTYKNYRIVYFEDEFVYKNIFGKEKTFSYIDVHYLNSSGNSGNSRFIIALHNGKKVSVPFNFQGASQFYNFVNEKTRFNP